MVVTEIALLHLFPNTTVETPALRTNLAHAKTVMQNYTNRTFYYAQQVEDPSYIYIIGEWDSLDDHMNGFIPSPENQALLESLKDLVTVDWLQHIDVPHKDVPLPETNNVKKDGCEEVTYSIGRHFIKDGKKEEFKKTFEENKHYLQDYVTEGTIGGGWRVDKEDNKEEFVLFCPWNSVEQHYGFAKTLGFEKYGQIREFVDGADIKHAKIFDF